MTVPTANELISQLGYAARFKVRGSLVKTFGVFLFLLGVDWCAAQAEQPHLRVNGQRLVHHLEALSEYGKNPQGGVSRVAYTAADLAGREYVMGLMREAGLAVSIDVAGNLVGTRAGTDSALKPILIGSHIDSVPEGGNYDGDVGSLGAIEVAQTLKENKLTTRHPLEVIVFADEEGGTIGSHALSGEITDKQLSLVTNSGK